MEDFRIYTIDDTTDSHIEEYNSDTESPIVQSNVNYNIFRIIFIFLESNDSKFRSCK